MADADLPGGALNGRATGCHLSVGPVSDDLLSQGDGPTKEASMNDRFPQLGTDPATIYREWEAAGARWNFGGRTVVGWVPGAGVFCWCWGQLWRCHAPAPRTLAWREEASPADLLLIDWAIRHGALQ